jgi:hypothetical protein
MCACRQDVPGDGQLAGQQAPRGPGAPEEDPRPSRPEALLGCARARPAHQDHRQEGQDRRCLQEEVETQLFRLICGGLRE